MDRRRFVRTCAGALALGHGGCSAGPTGSSAAWAMFQSDPANTGYQPTGPARRWRTAVGDALWTPIDSPPAVVAGGLYVGSRDGAVYALVDADG